MLDSSSTGRTPANSNDWTFWIVPIGLVATVGLAYFLAGRLSLALLKTPDGLAAFWPASGIAAGSIIAFGPAARMPVAAAVLVAATMLASLNGDQLLPAGIVFGVSNAGEALLIAWLVEHHYGPRFSLDGLPRVLGFFLATGLGTALSGVGGAAGVALSEGSGVPVLATWLHWFTSDAIGVIVVAPLVIGAVRTLQEPPDLRELGEGVSLLAVLAVASVLAFGGSPGQSLSIVAPAMLLPLLIWPAARCQPVFAAAGVFVLALVIVWSITFGPGRPPDASVPDRLLAAQSSLIAVAACALVVGALFAERRAREALLRSSNKRLGAQEKYFRQLLGSLPAAIHTTDAAGRITYCNKAATDLWGTRPELGKDKCSDLGRLYYPDGTLVPPDQCPTKACLGARQAMKGCEALFERPDGTRIPIIPYPAPLTDDDGNVVGAVSMKIDISEQVQARRALAESEARFRATFENAAVGVALVGCDGSIQRANSSFARMLGYSAEELKTRTFQDLTHPDDLASNISLFNKTLVGEADSYSIEKRYVRKDGEIIWASLTVGCVRKADNAVDYFISVIQDVNGRKQAEARLAERNAQLDLAHKAARVGWYTHDLAARTMRISLASTVTHGLTNSTMDIPGEQWCARVHRDDRERLRTENIRAFKERQREIISEFRFVRPGGEVRWIEARSLIAYDDAGRAERMTGVYIDVTERRKAEDHKNLLIAELDHRVKNVLACVAAVAQRSRECSRSADEFLDVLNGRINSLANAHALLSRSRWEGVGLGDLVRSELAPCTNGGNNLIDGPEVVLAAEATQPLAMVLHELATNATKYGALSNSHGRVSVCWGRETSKWRDHLALEWLETGGPRVAAAGPSGYGSSVIRNLIPYELGGSVDYVLAPDGVRCRVEIPSKWLRNGFEQSGRS
jgi:PAS domain S-box-containing protein